MITNNAKKIFLAYGSGVTDSITGTCINNVITGDYIQPNNQYPGLALGAGNGVDGSWGTIASGKGMLDVGFGDTAESPNDYKLADGNQQNAKLTRIAMGKNSYTTGDILSIYANFKNNGNANVVVKEIGYYANPCNQVRYTSNSNTCLLFRKVLENPVTIAPGETYAFSYNVRFRS